MAKTIAAFIDGTGQEMASKVASNVCRLHERCLAADGVEPENFWYRNGVGTDRAQPPRPPRWLADANLKPPSKLLNRVVANIAGSAAGYGVERRIKEAYAFLVSRYETGDRVFLFGFSRGAHMVRSLAGFLDQVGILMRSHIAEVERAYRIYVSGDPKSEEYLRRYLRRLTGASAPSDNRDAPTTMPIHLLGVWDTVAVHGLPRNVERWLPSLSTQHHEQPRVPRYVTHARHALALHECRSSFEPVLFDDAIDAHQTLRQTWFAGAHADVGGGYDDHGEELSAIALEWMACEARALGLNVAAYPKHLSMRDRTHVHHECKGPFFWEPGRVRRFVRAAATTNPLASSSHDVHLSAARRLLCLTGEPYPFARGDVRDACHEVDRLTAQFVMRQAAGIGRWPQAPGSCP
jgi:uncharacterized protein (DUF2235 family)